MKCGMSENLIEEPESSSCFDHPDPEFIIEGAGQTRVHKAYFINDLPTEESGGLQDADRIDEERFQSSGVGVYESITDLSTLYIDE